MKHLFTAAAALFCVAIFWYQAAIGTSSSILWAGSLLLTIMLPIASAQYIYTGKRKIWASVLGVVATMCVLVFATALGARQESPFLDCPELRAATLELGHGCDEGNTTISDSRIVQYAQMVYIFVVAASILNFGLVLASILWPHKQSKVIQLNLPIRLKRFWPNVILVSIGISLLTMLVPTPHFMQPDTNSYDSLATSYYGVPYPAREVKMADCYEPTWCLEATRPYGYRYDRTERSTYNLASIVINAAVWTAVGSALALFIRRQYK